LHNLIICIEGADGRFETDAEEWYREGIKDGRDGNDKDDEEDDSGGAENGEDDGRGHGRMGPPGVLFCLDKMQVLLNSV